MAIQVKQMLCPASKKSIKYPYAMTPTRIVVHNTANDASAVQEITYMNNNNNNTSFHFAIDDKEVVQGLPLNVNGWHAGDGASGKGNREGIGIEICYSKSGGTRFIAAEKLAAKFIAQLLDERNWGIDKVTKHQDYSGKYCPHRTLDMGWGRFLSMIKVELDALKKPVVTTTPTTTVAGLTKGAKLNLSNVALYASSSTATKASAKTGVFYIWSADVVNGRVRITNSTANVGVSGRVTGWISATDAKKSISSTSAATTSKPTTTTSKPAATTNTSTTIVTGRQIKLTNAGLYASSSTSKVTRTISGVYYIWSAQVVNNRVRITNSKANVGKSGQVTGWVAVSSFGGKATTTTTTPTKTSTSSSTSKLSTGRAIKLSGCPLYSSAGALFKSSKVTGTYYLWSSEVVKNRIRITNSKANVGKAGKVTGWIKVSDVK